MKIARRAVSVLTAIASIERILNLNHIPSDGVNDHHDPLAANGLIPQSTPILNADGEPIWKALVFDNLGRDVISSVLRVPALREWGITLHLYVQSGRKFWRALLQWMLRLKQRALTGPCQKHQRTAASHTRYSSRVSR